MSSRDHLSMLRVLRYKLVTSRVLSNYSDTARDKSIYKTLAERSTLVVITSSDLERRDAKGLSFPENLRNYAPTVSPITTKFAVVTLVGRDVCSGVRLSRLKGREEVANLSREFTRPSAC